MRISDWSSDVCSSDLSGAVALDRLAEDPSIHLLLTDVVMPEMTGPELALAARDVRPGLSVMFTTGYAGSVEDAGGRGAELLGTTPILHKPFPISALEAEVREAMGHLAAARAQIGKDTWWERVGPS